MTQDAITQDPAVVAAANPDEAVLQELEVTPVTRYCAKDGSEHPTRGEAGKRNRFLVRRRRLEAVVEQIMGDNAAVYKTDLAETLASFGDDLLVALELPKKRGPKAD